MDYTKVSCALRSTQYPKIHYFYDDQRIIANGDVAGGSLLRVYQRQSDTRQRLLREKYTFPNDVMPPDEMLWFDVSSREIEAASCHVRSKSTYERILNEDPQTDEEHATVRSGLIRRGLVKTRWIARRGEKARPATVATHVQYDALDGKTFVVVLDSRGTYVGNDEQLHDATQEGYDVIVRQCLFCFEKFNQEIAKLDGVDPPQPVPRWDPKQKKDGAPASVTATQPQSSHAPHQGNMQNLTRFKEVSIQRPAKSCIFQNQNITSGSATSTIDATSSQSTNVTSSSGGSMSEASSDVGDVPDSSSSADFTLATAESDAYEDQHSISGNTFDSALRTAPKTPETILKLLARHLKVPARPDGRNKKALKRYEQDWYEPCAWMCHATDDVEPSRAWELIERRAVGMQCAPIWYATEREQTPFTARHMVGWDKALLKDKGELRLTGQTWKDIGRQLDEKNWYPEHPTPYDGPPLPGIDRASMHAPLQPGGIVAPPPRSGEIKASPQATSSAEEPRTDEMPVIAAPAGMSRREVEQLRDDIHALYPMLYLAIGRWPGCADYALGIKAEEDDEWLDIFGRDEWEQPSTEIQAVIEKGFALAAPAAARSSPVAPIIIDAESLADQAMSIEEIEADLRRPTPLVQPSPPPAAPMPTATPPSLKAAKEGLAKEMAAMMLKSLAERGNSSAQLQDLPNGRYVIQLGDQRIDSGAAWSRWLAAAAMNSSGNRTQAVT